MVEGMGGNFDVSRKFLTMRTIKLYSVGFNKVLKNNSCAHNFIRNLPLDFSDLGHVSENITLMYIKATEILSNLYYRLIN